MPFADKTIVYNGLDGPAWFAAMAVKQYVGIAGGPGFGAAFQNGNRASDIPTLAAEADLPAAWTAWSGADRVLTRLEWACVGGHNDRDKNSAWGIDFNAAVPGMVLRRASGTTAGGDFSANGTATYADGRPRASHTNNRLIGAAGALFISGFDAMSGGASFDSSAWAYFDYSLGDYVMKPQVFNSAQWADAGAFHGGASILDPTTNLIWVFSQGVDNIGKYGCYVIDATTKAIVRRFKIYMPWGYQMGVCIHDTSPKVLWIAEGFGGVNIIDITTLPADGAQLTYTAVNTSGIAFSRWGPRSGADHNGMFYHAPSHAILAQDTNSVANVIKIAVPTPVTGTYAASAIAIGGVTPSATQPNGTFNRWNCIPSLSTTHDLVVLSNAHNQPIYGFKVSRTGGGLT